MMKKLLLVTMLLVPAMSIAQEESRGLSLEGALQKTMKDSPVLGEERARLGAAAGEAQQAAAWLNPSFEFEAENFGGGGQFSGTDVAEYTYALAQKLEVGGKRSARSDAAFQRLKAAQADYAVAERVLRREVTIAYMSAVAAAQNLNLAGEQAELAQTVLATVTKRVEAAREPEIQQRKAEVAYATAMLKRQQAAREAQVAKTALAAFWGATSLDENPLADSFYRVSTPVDFSAYELQLVDAPQFERYKSLIKARKAVVNLEKAQNVPDPTFRVGVRDFNQSGDQALIAGLSLPLPVFNRNAGNIRRALSEVTAVEQRQQQARLMLTQQLRESWQAWQQGAKEATRLQAAIIPAAEEAFSLAREGYDKGRFPYLEVLDAQRTLFEARAQYQNALLRMHTARAEVTALAQNTTKELKEENNETEK